MAGISKRIRGSWVSSDYGVMKTATDIITTLPAVIYPNDTTATVGLKGNTAQNDTPTPQNPVMPNGTGERTGNLFDFNVWYTQISPTRCIVSKTRNAITITATGNDSYTGNGGLHVPVESDTEYTFHFTSDNDNSGSIYLFENGIVDSAHTHAFNNNNKKQVTFTTLSDTTFLTVRLGVYNSGNSITYSNIMLNSGSTPIPYEPYGYKNPILSANTITPVYLGEVQTARQIKKLVLDGTESVSKDTGQDPTLYFLRYKHIQINGYCTHLRSVSSKPQSGEFSTVAQYDGYIFMNFGADIMNAQPSGNTVEGFKEYLAAQYAAGTPVTVWYVLATPETAVVNEPLMRIGDYADAVSNVSIPVTAGECTLSVDTTIQPSKVTVNYKGWHPVQSAHEKSMNLFDYQTMAVSRRGYALTADGSESANVQWSISDYILINGSSFVLSKVGGNSFAICFYNANKQYVYGQAYATGGATSKQSIICNVGTEVQYARFSYVHDTANPAYDNIANIMLNEGDTALPYEPYWT